MSEERYWAGDTTGRDPGTELDELRRACARVLGADPETWPSHGNAPLAISAGFALAHRERGDARQRIAELEAENTSLRQPVVSYDEQGESIGVWTPVEIGRLAELEAMEAENARLRAALSECRVAARIIERSYRLQRTDEIVREASS